MDDEKVAALIYRMYQIENNIDSAEYCVREIEMQSRGAFGHLRIVQQDLEHLKEMMKL